jgi:hypothetical protein
MRHFLSLKTLSALTRTVYWYYFTSVLYHAAMGMMEGIGFAGTIDRIKRNFWKTATSAWIYWGPATLLNFTFVPLRHQVRDRSRSVSPPLSLSVSLVACMWRHGVLSF